METLTDPETLDQQIFDAISEIQGIKRDSRLFPDYAMMPEVFNFLRPEYGERFENMEADLKEGIRRLCRAKRIEWHMTVNGILMFGVRNQSKQTAI